MKPTAISQIIEQFVKLILGVILVSLFMPNIEMAVAGATLAITISEVVALGYLFLKYKSNKFKLGLTFSYQKQHFFKDSKTIIKTTIPITLVGIMIPFSQVIDSFLTINILGKYLDNATSLYGLLSGVVMTVINLPVSICYGLAVVAIPSLSSSKTQAETNKKGIKIILLTIAFSLPALIFLLIFAPFSINLLYSRLNQSEKIIAIALLRLTSPCVVLLSLVQATNAILIGRGKLYAPVLTLFVGVIIKTILNLLLLSNVNMNIYGGAIAIIACYFFVCLVNLILLRVKGTRNENKSTFNC
jgi:stage V sporulation protein B